MSEQDTNRNNNDEVDIIQLFKLIGDGIKSIFRVIGVILYNFYVFFIAVLMFFFKNILYILAAALVGFLISYFYDDTSVEFYTAEAIVEPNFQVELELKSRISEFNELISNGDSVQLAQKLKIMPSEAGKLLGFSIDPIFSLNKERFDYYDYIYEQDTALTKKFTFDMYLEDMKFEDYQEFSITVLSLDKEIYSKFDSNIWDFTSSANIKKRQRQLTESYRVNRKYLENTLQSIDSTRATLRLAMISEANRPNNTSTNIDMGSKAEGNNDQALYNYERTLRLELMQVIKSMESTEEIVNVIKDFPESGTKGEVIKRNYFLVGAVALTIFILLFIRLIRYLKSIDRGEGLRYKKL